MKPFAHLHVHSEYSIFDGLASIKDLVNKAIADGTPGMALTDHGNMMGVKYFIDYVTRINKEREKDNLEPFKPIIGCEMNVTDDAMVKHSFLNSGSHLTVLAKDIKGYHNLISLVSQWCTQGLRFRPQINKQQLKDHSGGLIVCSGCLGGEVAKLILSGETDKAEQAILWFKEVFGDDYYLEIQRHKASSGNSNHDVYSAQQKVEKLLIELGRKHDIKVVATNDVHFLNKEDAEAHDRLICIATGQSVNDPEHIAYTKQEWLKSTAEMNELFADVPECLENSLEILNKVKIFSINRKTELPNVPLPDGVENANDYLRSLTYEGACNRWGETLTPVQKSRLENELNFIEQSGFSKYFLILHDLVCAAGELGIIVGPGRGSAAGSAVCYCLGITQVDPIEFNLLFERFINPEHPMYPGIDLDLDNEGRNKAIAYLTEKYGRDKVAGIIALRNMSARESIKEVAKAEGLSSSEGSRLAETVMSRLRQGNGWYNRISLNDIDKYQDIIEHPDASVRNTLKYARQLENTVCGYGLHACGLVIGKDAVSKYAPLCMVREEHKDHSVIATQYDGYNVEDVGLLRLDLLGLNTLSVIKEALDAIKSNSGIEVDVNNIPIDDPKTYQLYSEGRTLGTFLFESEGMQKYLRLLRPQKFDELIALNALYRPGPLDLIPTYIRRKRGLEPIAYDIPLMEKYLSDTYGVLVYQEQMMQLSQALANFTPDESDTLRKAIAKKQVDKMTELKSKFIEGGHQNGHDQKCLKKIWDDWNKFATYLFNKSHATCYTLIAYQTAWLKTNYPKEYLTVVLNHIQDDEEKYAELLNECEAMEIKL